MNTHRSPPPIPGIVVDVGMVVGGLVVGGVVVGGVVVGGGGSGTGGGGRGSHAISAPNAATMTNVLIVGRAAPLRSRFRTIDFGDSSSAKSAPSDESTGVSPRNDNA